MSSEKEQEKAAHDCRKCIRTLQMVLELVEHGFDFKTTEGADLVIEAKHALESISTLAEEHLKNLSR